MVRAGETDTSVTVNVENENVSVSDPTVCRKGFRVTYHPSGRVNFHHITGASVFMEPIFQVTRPEALINFSIPDTGRLDSVEKLGTDDAVIDVPGGRLSFAVAIAPWDTPPTRYGMLWAWTWRPLFSLWLLAAPPPPQAILDVQPQHFHYLPRQIGLFQHQFVSKDEALVRFHQSLNGTESDILYYPDGEGICRMVFVVPMRGVPCVEINLRDQNLTAEITKVTTTEIRYRVWDKQRRPVRDARAVDVIHYIRDAEL